MQYPQRFSALPEYAFPRLRTLLAPFPAGGDLVAMSIGEPQHRFPDFIPQIIAENADGFNVYPPNNGAPELRAAIARWLETRFGLTKINEDTEVFPLNGTREGLFNACLALSPETKNGQKPAILMPNPFYQCYMVAARAVGADPIYVNAEKSNDFLPDFHALPTETLDRTTIVYMCSPSNPQGAVASAEYWKNLLALAQKHDFRVFADECYSEIYREAPPAGILAAVQETGVDPERVLAFHSLSKRSNLPGLRSGFVAGGPKSIAELLQLRGYTGAPLPLPLQKAAAAAWADETHVIENRTLYQKKFSLADRILGNVPEYRSPQAGFFLWLKAENGEIAALKLWQNSGVKVLPGAYLSHDTPNGNPGHEYIRVALVADFPDLERGLTAIRDYLLSEQNG